MTERSIFDLCPVLREYMTTAEVAGHLHIHIETARLILQASESRGAQLVRGPGTTLWIKREFIERYAEVRAQMEEEDQKWVLENEAKHKPRRNRWDVLNRMNSVGYGMPKNHRTAPTGSGIDIGDLFE